MSPASEAANQRGFTMPCKTTEDKISKALAYYARYAHILHSDDPFTQLLSRYRRTIADSAKTMWELGVAGQCGDCADNGPGGCCSRSVEDWYDAMLLFVNLLLGCDLQEVRPLAEDCHFVSASGCTLIARHYFCVHFLCPALKDRLGPAANKQLLAVVSEELQLGWEVEQYLYRLVDSR
jgi:hypothetical protein